MKRFIEGEARTQVTLLPECLDDYVAEENSVRVVDVFVDELDLGALGFEGVDPAAPGRPAYHPAVLRVRKRTVEHPFGTLKQWMGATHFLTRKLAGVSAEMSLNVLAYNLKRVMKIIGGNGLMKALTA